MANELFSLVCFGELMAFVVPWVPMIIFFVVIALAVWRFVGFYIAVMLVILVFVGRFAIEHYDVMQNSSINGIYPTTCQEWRDTFNGYKECIIGGGCDWYEQCRTPVDKLKQPHLTMNELSRRFEIYQVQKQTAEAGEISENNVLPQLSVDVEDFQPPRMTP